jgi:glycosyltransferase involved in cell wall biosynthesis
VTRVALLPSAYLPSLGGVEELTRHLALALRSGGDEVEVWTGTEREEDPARAERLDGIVVRRLPFPLPAASPAAMARFARHLPGAVRAFRDAVGEFRPDVLHVQCFGPNGVYAAYLADRVGVPLVITLQGETVMDDLDIFEHSRVSRTGLRRGLRRARAVTACSGFTLADAERRFGLPSGRGSVVFNGVDLGAAAGTHTARPPAVGTAPYVLALGRVVEKKGFDLLLRAFAQIPDARGVVLVIGGDGAARPGLESLAALLGLDGRVRFAGRLPRDEVAAAMAHAEVLVVPSRIEPFGIVVLEGWRAGTAVVATARGGPPEFVTDGIDGRVVDPFDTAALAGALYELLGDDGARRAMGAAGRRAVEPFDWPKIAEAYRRCYRQALVTA